MRQFVSIQQVQAGSHTFDGVAGSGAATVSAADGNNHALYSFADQAHAGVFDPDIAGSPKKVRKLERLTIELSGSVAWHLDVYNEAGTLRNANAILLTSQRFTGSGESLGLYLLPGETIKFYAAAQGTVTMTFSEDA